MPEAVSRRTVVVLLLVVTLLSAGVGAACATFADDDASSSPPTVRGRTGDPAPDALFRAPRRPYTPVAYGNGVSISAEWSGNYARAGRLGVLSITGRVTGPWRGQGFLELSLPPGWRAQRHHEAATITGWVGPNPSAGVHWGMLGVVHPGADRLRFIAMPNEGTSRAWFAVDGVTTPTQFTGDADPGHQTEFHATGWVLLD
jgi:hypothetical protein